MAVDRVQRAVKQQLGHELVEASDDLSAAVISLLACEGLSQTAADVGCKVGMRPHHSKPQALGAEVSLDVLLAARGNDGMQAAGLRRAASCAAGDKISILRPATEKIDNLEQIRSAGVWEQETLRQRK